MALTMNTNIAVVFYIWLLVLLASSVGFAFEGPWKDYKPCRFVEQTFNLLQGRPVPPTAVPEGILLWADPKLARRAGTSPYKEAEKIDITRNSEQFGTIGRIRSTGPRVFPSKIENNCQNGSGFDWMQNWTKMKTPTCNGFPPGLSKSQRKKYIEYNETRMKTELGIFFPADEPKPEFKVFHAKTPMAKIQEDDDVKEGNMMSAYQNYCQYNYGEVNGATGRYTWKKYSNNPGSILSSFKEYVPNQKYNAAGI